MAYRGERPHMEASARKALRSRGPDALRAYQRDHNAHSLDGLPAVKLPPGA